MKKFIASVFVVVLSATMVFASNVEGRWKAKMDTQNGPVEFYVVYKVDGNKISGSLESDNGSIDFGEGTIKGDEFEYTYTYEGYTIINTGKYANGKIVVTWEADGNTGEVTLTKVE